MTSNAGGPRSLLVPLLLLSCAFVFWCIVFVLPAGNFWLKISVAASLLASGSLAGMGERRASLFRFRWTDLMIGLSSAALLYGVFLAGKMVLTAILPRAGADIGLVYAPRGSLPIWLIGALLLLVTGPAEELFWRGMIQDSLSERLGTLPGLALTSVLYALVHLCTLNPPLILAALTAGLFWGALFAWRTCLPAVIVSHALWSVLIFIVFPVA